jgi:hypothetical protein
MTPDEWRSLFSDIAIPAAAILVPTGIAIWLARRERAAADQQRERDEARLTQQRAEADAREQADARRRAVEAALQSMADLLEAAFTIDPITEAAIRIRGATRMGAMRLDLTADEDPVFSWIAHELGIVGLALNDRTDQPRLPRYGDQIVWRSAHFVDALIDWVSGDKAVAWFKDVPEIPIEHTTKPAKSA